MLVPRRGHHGTPIYQHRSYLDWVSLACDRRVQTTRCCFCAHDQLPWRSDSSQQGIRKLASFCAARATSPSTVPSKDADAPLTPESPHASRRFFLGGATVYGTARSLHYLPLAANPVTLPLRDCVFENMKEMEHERVRKQRRNTHGAPFTSVVPHLWPSFFPRIRRARGCSLYFAMIMFSALKRSALGGKGEGGWRRASPILWMRPRSMPESGAWEHSLLVADGPKKRGLLSACGSGRDDIGSGVSMDDNLSLQLCDEPRPWSCFFLRGASFRSLRGDQYHRSSVALPHRPTVQRS